MKYLLLIFIVFPMHIFAQLNSPELKPNIRRNTFFCEALGNAGSFSINYDRLIGRDTPFASIRIGLIGKSNYENNSVPVEFSILVGEKSHKAEIGVGFTGFVDDYEFEKGLLIFRGGYRYQPGDGGLFIKAGITPYLIVVAADENEGGIRFWGGFGVGYTF